MSEELKIKRSSNFSSNEKQLLFSLVHKYKDVIENKKTDGTTNEKKNEVWNKICNEFNASSPDIQRRNMSSLKKLYNNRKREIRKIVAEETKEKYLTGGGPAPKQEKGGEQDLVLSIMNYKTVYGHTNNFDSDADPQPSGSQATGTVQLPDINDVFIEKCEKENTPPNKRVKTKSSDKPAEEIVIESTNWNHPTATSLATATSSALKRKTDMNTPRRRPATVVRALTSSDLAGQYKELLNRRLAIADLEAEALKRDMLWKKEKQELERDSLLLDIAIKKAKLEQLQKNIINHN